MAYVNNSAAIYISTNGVDWTLNDIPNTGNTTFGYANGIYAAADWDGVAISTDMTNWNDGFGNYGTQTISNILYSSDSPFFQPGDYFNYTNVDPVITAGNNLFLMYLGFNYYDSLNDSFNDISLFMTSTDAVNWNNHFIDNIWNTNSRIGLAYLNGKFYARDSLLDSGQTGFSTDGLSWTLISLDTIISTPDQMTISPFVNVNDRIFLLSESGNGKAGKTAYTQDGIAWNKSAMYSPDFKEITSSATYEASINFRSIYTIAYGKIPYYIEKENLIFDSYLNPGETRELSPGIILNANQSIIIQGDASMGFSAQGVEL